jgi:hypothetical protein
MALLMSYPLERSLAGITVNELFRDHPGRLKHVPSVLAAIYLLEKEWQVQVERSTGHENYLDSIRVYPPTGVDIPPSVPCRRDEVHSVMKQDGREDVVRIEFYQTPGGKYFVWPYVGQIGKSYDSYKHFRLRMHFDDVDSARECAIGRGKMLTELGFLHNAD